MSRRHSRSRFGPLRPVPDEEPERVTYDEESDEYPLERRRHHRRREDHSLDHAPWWQQVLVRQGLATLIVLALLGWALLRLYPDLTSKWAREQELQQQHNTAVLEISKRTLEKLDSIDRGVCSVRYHVDPKHRECPKPY